MYIALVLTFCCRAVLLTIYPRTDKLGKIIISYLIIGSTFPLV